MNYFIDDSWIVLTRRDFTTNGRKNSIDSLMGSGFIGPAFELRLTKDYIIVQEDMSYMDSVWDPYLQSIVYTNSTRLLFKDVSPIPNKLLTKITKEHPKCFYLNKLPSLEAHKYSCVKEIYRRGKIYICRGKCIDDSLKDTVVTIGTGPDVSECHNYPVLQVIFVDADKIQGKTFFDFSCFSNLVRVCFEQKYEGLEPLSIRIGLKLPHFIVIDSLGDLLSIEDLEIVHPSPEHLFHWNDTRIVPTGENVARRYFAAKDKSYDSQNMKVKSDKSEEQKRVYTGAYSVYKIYKSGFYY